MKKRLQGFIAGTLVGVVIAGGTALAVSTTTLYDVITSGVNIVMDGNKLIPRDVNGNVVEPMIYNGTTYLPVRAISNAVGKAVYWDGETTTVYLGNMDGELEYPTLKLSDVTNIGQDMYEANPNALKDNYENYYSEAIHMGKQTGEREIEILLNGKYSKFKGTIYVPNGITLTGESSIVVEADGKNIYSKNGITKSSAPIPFDISVKGCNNLKIKMPAYSGMPIIHLGDAGFYQ